MKKLKIAFLVTLFPRLSETFILNQITGLIDRGHEVDIYAFGPGGEPKVHEDVSKYHLLSRTFYYGDAISNMPDSKILRLLKGCVLLISNFHKKPRAFLNALNIFKFKKEAANLSILYRIVPFADGGHYDVVHCHFGPNGSLGVFLKDVGVFTGKVMTVFHGYDITHYIQSNGRGVYDDLFKKGDLFLPISERWKNELISLGCSEDKIMVHRMGIDAERYSDSQHKTGNNKKTRILSVARFVEKKGIAYGVEAVGKIVREHPDIEYRIIGDGELRGEVDSVINRLELREKVKLLGWRSQEEILAFMKDSDILLVPSVTSKDGDQEGIPVVLMEAMAMGLPVVSTYHSGIPELVQDGESGFLVPERDADTLAKRLKYLIEHQNVGTDMGQVGRSYVKENYDINKLNDRLVQIYQQQLYN